MAAVILPGLSSHVTPTPGATTMSAPSSSFLDAEQLQALCVQYGYAALACPPVPECPTVPECPPACPHGGAAPSPYPPAERFYLQLWGAGALLYLIGYLTRVLQGMLCPARPSAAAPSPEDARSKQE